MVSKEKHRANKAKVKSIGQKVRYFTVSNIDKYLKAIQGFGIALLIIAAILAYNLGMNLLGHG